MILNLKSMLYDIVANQLIVSHLNKKIKFNVSEVSKCSSKFKSAVEKAQNKNFLKDADYVIQFAEPVVDGQTSDVQKDEEAEDKEKPQNTNTEEKVDKEEGKEEKKENTDNTEDAESASTDDSTDSSSEDKKEKEDEQPSEEDEEKEDTADDKEGEDEDKDDDKVNESKIEDITSSMCSTIKTKVKTGTKPCSCGKKIVQEKDSEKKDDKKMEDKETEVKKEDEVTTEAETEASGDELKLKVQKSLKKSFGISDSEKIEFFDLPGFADGYNIYFAKLSFKEEPKETSSEKDTEDSEEK